MSAIQLFDLNGEQRFTGTSVGGGGSQPALHLFASLHNANAAPAGGESYFKLPFSIAYPVSATTYSIVQAEPSLLVIITDAATQYVAKAQLALVGQGGYTVPGPVQTLVAGWGAAPTDVLDISSLPVIVTCISGVDAGKQDIWKPDYTTPLPLPINPVNAVLPLVNKVAGNLGTTVDGSPNYRIDVANAGTYYVSFAAAPDFFYP